MLTSAFVLVNGISFSRSTGAYPRKLGGGGEDGGRITPLPDPNKFILPTTKNLPFFEIKTIFSTAEFLVSCYIYVERGYHNATFDFIKWHI